MGSSAGNIGVMCLMTDTEFVLYTLCPAGHSVPFRRTLSTWRLSLDAPSVVLWCYECGLQWDALEHDRAIVAEEVGRATAVQAELSAADVSDRDLQSHAIGPPALRITELSRLGGAASSANQPERQATPLAISPIRQANGHRPHIRDCGRGRRAAMLAANRDLPRSSTARRPIKGSRCRAIRLLEEGSLADFNSELTLNQDARLDAAPTERSLASTRTCDTNLSSLPGFLSETETRALELHAVVERGRWLAATGVAVAIVGLLALLWNPQHGLIRDTVNEASRLRPGVEPAQGADGAIVSESTSPARGETTVEQRAETSSVIAARVFDQATAHKSPAVPNVPILTFAATHRATASPAAGQNSKSAVSESGIVLTARIPAGTLVPLSLETPVRSTTSPGAPVHARVRSDVIVRKQVVIPRGSLLHGHVASVERPQSPWISALKVWEFGKVRRVELRFTTLQMPGSPRRTYRIRTAPVDGRAKSASRRVAIPTAFATVGGAILAGPLGAAGGGIAARAVAGSTDDGTRLPRGTPMSAQLLDAVHRQ
jgi:hypothetical protein